MMTRPIVTCLPFMLLFGASSALAQRPTEPPAGSRVRIQLADSLRQAPYMARARYLIGTLARATSDTLWLDVGGVDTVRVPRSALRALDVSRGASRVASAVEHGAVAALVASAILRTSADDEDGRRRALGVSGLAGLIAGVIGALRPYERWRRVRLSKQ